MIVIKIGRGQTPSGKILDRDTTWYAINIRKGINEKADAIRQHLKTGQPIYISRNNKAYKRITLDDLRKL